MDRKDQQKAPTAAPEQVRSAYERPRVLSRRSVRTVTLASDVPCDISPGNPCGGQ